MKWFALPKGPKSRFFELLEHIGTRFNGVDVHLTHSSNVRCRFPMHLKELMMMTGQKPLSLKSRPCGVAAGLQCEYMMSHT